MEESLPLRRSTRRSVVAKNEELTPRKRNVATLVNNEPVTPSRRTRASSTTPKKSLIESVLTPKKTLSVLNEEETPKKRKMTSAKVSNLTPKKGDKECSPKKLELKKTPKRTVTTRRRTTDGHSTPKKDIQEEHRKSMDNIDEIHMDEERPLTRHKRKTIAEKPIAEVETSSGETEISNVIQSKKSANFADLSLNRCDLKAGDLSSTALVPKTLISDFEKLDSKTADRMEYITDEKESVMVTKNNFESISPLKAEDIDIKSPQKIPDQYKSTSEKSLVSKLENVNNCSVNLVDIKLNSQESQILSDPSNLQNKIELESKNLVDSEKNYSCDMKVIENDSAISSDLSENLSSMTHIDKDEIGAIKDAVKSGTNIEFKTISENKYESERTSLKNNEEPIPEVKTRCESPVENITAENSKLDLSNPDIKTHVQTNKLVITEFCDDKSVNQANICCSKQNIGGNEMIVEEVESVGANCTSNIDPSEDTIVPETNLEISLKNEIIDMENNTQNNSSALSQISDKYDSQNIECKSSEIADGIVTDVEPMNSKDIAISNNTNALMVSGEDLSTVSKVMESDISGPVLTQTVSDNISQNELSTIEEKENSHETSVEQIETVGVNCTRNVDPSEVIIVSKTNHEISLENEVIDMKNNSQNNSSTLCQISDINDLQNMVHRSSEITVAINNSTDMEYINSKEIAISNNTKALMVSEEDLSTVGKAMESEISFENGINGPILTQTVSDGIVQNELSTIEEKENSLETSVKGVDTVAINCTRNADPSEVTIEPETNPEIKLQNEIIDMEKSTLNKSSKDPISHNSSSIMDDISPIVTPDEGGSLEAVVFETKNNFEATNTSIISESNIAATTNEEKNKNPINCKENEIDVSDSPVVNVATNLVEREIFTDSSSLITSNKDNCVENESVLFTGTDTDAVSKCSYSEEKSLEKGIFEKETNKSILMKINDEEDHLDTNDVKNDPNRISSMNIDRNEIGADKECIRDEYTETNANKESRLRNVISLKSDINQSFLPNRIEESFSEPNLQLADNQETSVTNDSVKSSCAEAEAEPCEDKDYICDNNDSKVIGMKSLEGNGIHEPTPTQFSNQEVALESNDLLNIKEIEICAQSTPDAKSKEKLESTSCYIDVNKELCVEKNQLEVETSNPEDISESKQDESLKNQSICPDLNGAPGTSQLDTIQYEDTVLDVLKAENFNCTTLICKINSTTAVEKNGETVSDQAIVHPNDTHPENAKDIEESEKSLTDSLCSNSFKIKKVDKSKISKVSIGNKEMIVNNISQSMCSLKNDVARSNALSSKGDGLDDILMSPKDFLNSDEESIVDDKTECYKLNGQEKIELQSDASKPANGTLEAEENSNKSNVDICYNFNFNGDYKDAVKNENITTSEEVTSIEQELSIIENDHEEDIEKEINKNTVDKIRVLEIDGVKSDTYDIKNNEITKGKCEKDASNSQMQNSSNLIVTEHADGDNLDRLDPKQNDTKLLIAESIDDNDTSLDGSRQMIFSHDNKKDSGTIFNNEIVIEETIFLGTSDTLPTSSENNINDPKIRQDYLDKSCKEDSKNNSSLKESSETNSPSLLHLRKKYKRIILHDCTSDSDDPRIASNKYTDHDHSDENVVNKRTYSRNISSDSCSEIDIKTRNHVKKNGRNRDDNAWKKISGKTFIDFEAEVGEEWSDDDAETLEEVSSCADSVTSPSGFLDREAVEEKRKVKKRCFESEGSDSNDYVDSVPLLFHSPTNSPKDDRLESTSTLYKKPKLENNLRTYKNNIPDKNRMKVQNHETAKLFRFNNDLKRFNFKSEEVYKEYTKTGVFVVSSMKQPLGKPKQCNSISHKKFLNCDVVSKEIKPSSSVFPQIDDAILRGFVVSKVKHDKITKKVSNKASKESVSENQNKGWKIERNQTKMISEKFKRKRYSPLEVTLILPSRSTSKSILSAMKRVGLAGILSIKFVKPKVAVVKFKKEESLKKALDLYGKLTIDNEPVYILEGSSCL